MELRDREQPEKPGMVTASRADLLRLSEEIEAAGRVATCVAVVRACAAGDFEEAKALLETMTAEQLHAFMGECLIICGMARRTILDQDPE